MSEKPMPTPNLIVHFVIPVASVNEANVYYEDFKAMTEVYPKLKISGQIMQPLENCCGKSEKSGP